MTFTPEELTGSNGSDGLLRYSDIGKKVASQPEADTTRMAQSSMAISLAELRQHANKLELRIIKLERLLIKALGLDKINPPS